jgi:hypothetical protein
MKTKPQIQTEFSSQGQLEGWTGIPAWFTRECKAAGAPGFGSGGRIDSTPLIRWMVKHRREALVEALWPIISSAWDAMEKLFPKGIDTDRQLNLEIVRIARERYPLFPQFPIFPE